MQALSMYLTIPQVRSSDHPCLFGEVSLPFKKILPDSLCCDVSWCKMMGGNIGSRVFQNGMSLFGYFHLGRSGVRKAD